MSGRLKLSNFAVSLDGFGTGDGLTRDEPFGHAGHRLHHPWMMATRFWREMAGQEGRSTGVNNEFAKAHWDGFGAEIMGRGKFWTGTGPIPDDWQGLWGADPPFHTPVIVLTHQQRADLQTEGTRFLFRDTTPQAALAEARELAAGQDVRLGGGVRTVREFLEADLVDELHVVVVPILLGRGQRLWDGQEALEDRFDLRFEPGDNGIMHVVGTRRRA